MAKLITVAGEIREIKPQNKKRGFSLNELYDLIGDGCELVQAVEYAKNKIFICDEEFRCRKGWEEKRNKTANNLILKETGDDWDLCGNIVICSCNEFK